MKILKFSALFLTGIAIFTACKDKTPPEPGNTDTRTRSEILRAKNWKVTSASSNGTEFWNTFLVEACNKDNQYKFRSDDSLVAYDMSNKCDPADPDSTVSFYKLYNSDKQMILNLQLSSSIKVNDTADIVILDDNTFQINAEYTGMPATITFKHP